MVESYVYQKAYVELFVPDAMLLPLVEHLTRYPDLTYQAINVKGEKRQNVSEDDVNAVTWGVFRGKEIVQPTVVDHQAFTIWKDEAFKAWVDTWALIYRAEKT